MAVAGLGLAFATQANASISYTFLENGQNVNLGNTSTFIESGVSLTASGFTTAGVATALYAKYTSGDPTETGLGTASDSDHEINSGNFVQLTLPTSPATTFNLILAGSVQTGETAKVYWTTTYGSLVGATLIGTLSGLNGQIIIPSGDATTKGYLDVTAGTGNVVIEGAQFTAAVPEPSTVVAGAMLLLPFGVSVACVIRNRKQAA